MIVKIIDIADDNFKGIAKSFFNNFLDETDSSFETS
jgi:hypothetical protein